MVTILDRRPWETMVMVVMILEYLSFQTVVVMTLEYLSFFQFVVVVGVVAVVGVTQRQFD